MSFDEGRTDALERTLWTCVQKLAEQMEFHRILADRNKGVKDRARRLHFEAREKADAHDIKLIKEIIDRL